MSMRRRQEHQSAPRIAHNELAPGLGYRFYEPLTTLL